MKNTLFIIVPTTVAVVLWYFFCDFPVSFASAWISVIALAKILDLNFHSFLYTELPSNLIRTVGIEQIEIKNESKADPVAIETKKLFEQQKVLNYGKATVRLKDSSDFHIDIDDQILKWIVLSILALALALFLATSDAKQESKSETEFYLKALATFLPLTIQITYLYSISLFIRKKNRQVS